MEKIIGIVLEYEDAGAFWFLEVTGENEVLITCNGEDKKYKTESPIVKVEVENNYFMVYTENGYAYSFEMDEDDRVLKVDFLNQKNELIKTIDVYDFEDGMVKL